MTEGRDDRVTRREFVGTAAAAAFLAPLLGRHGLANARSVVEMNTRSIPSSGVQLPVVGLGTWQTFDVGTSDRARRPLREVLRSFVDRGGRVVDASPMYGRAEAVVGDLAAELDVRHSLFYATKVWTRGRDAGIRQMETSAERMRASPIDLMQVHNLLDVDQHLATLREWKQEGRVRYIGVTHYQVSAYEALEALIRAGDLDFVQFNYSIATRESERRLLAVAADHGTAVIVNRPYEGGRLFRAVRRRQLPDWAAEFDCESWGQFFLKYILGAPEVTCVIPATSNPEHLRDNTGAGFGRFPDADLRRRMVEWIA